MSVHSIGVSNLDAFRIWKETESLGLDWMLDRIKGQAEETEIMRAGKALHKALEEGSEIECASFMAGEYRFDFNCDCKVVLPTVREAWLAKQYGDLQVRGIVDSLLGNLIVDYKATEQFDPDRYMESYQWRYYLDMGECDQFIYQVFVIRQFGPPQCYEVREVHQLKQYRYPELRSDCERLAYDCLRTIGTHLPIAKELEAVTA